MYTASASVRVKRSLAQVWNCLTDGRRLTDWFAGSADLRPGTSFRFDFGDGDFFAGEVTRWEEPQRLGLRWRFMGVGPTFDIEIMLEEVAGGTEVRVADRGSRTQADADVLRDGWVDFLARLARHAETGEPARYEWSEDINTTAVVARPRAELLELVRGESWWREAFPSPRLVPDGADARAEFDDPRWGAPTVATVKLVEAPDGTYLDVSHRGWGALPPEIRVAERRRFAELWAQALQRLESSYRARGSA
jgi:uncharacterized protein YndB with AHSA1/START domain